jgi:hypothetical protein
MKNYTARIGVYVRAYALFNFTAEDDAAAQLAAIAKFNADDSNIMFDETDWQNTCQPSIVSITDELTNEDLPDAEGVSFCLTSQDALDYSACEMQSALNYALAAMGSLRFQIEQMRASFGDDDKSIAEALEDHDSTVTKVCAVLERAKFDVNKPIYGAGSAATIDTPPPASENLIRDVRDIDGDDNYGG